MALVEGTFEAKVERRSENTKGIFITLLINPADHDEALSQVRVGSVLQIGWAEIVDASVQPLENIERFPPASLAQFGAENAATGLGKPKRKFSDLSLPEQAGIRCEDPDFRKFLCRSDSPHPGATAELAANDVRALCGIHSRAELSTNKDAANKWRNLNIRFEAWKLDQQYADSVRR